MGSGRSAESARHSKVGDVETPETCAAVGNDDLFRVCTYLHSEITKAGVDPLVTALIGVFAALLTAFMSAVSSHNLQRTERRNISQRQSLTELQNVASDLRGRWIDHFAYLEELRKSVKRGEESARPQNPFPDHEQTKLMGNLKTYISRIDSEPVRDSYSSWSEYAQYYFSGSDEFQSFDEKEKWDDAVQQSGGVMLGLDVSKRRWWAPWTWRLQR